MAKSVLELAVGTGQWDAGLKKAKSALDNFTQSQGGLQQALAKDSENMRKFVSMMGQTESTAKTAKGQMNDYKATIEQLTMQYNRMTDAQKKSIGQDYLQSIDQLKQKYQAVNEEIQEMNRSLNNVKAPDIADGVKASGLFGGGKLDGMLQVFGGNLMTKGFEMATGAITSMVNETATMIKQGVEMAKAGEGVRIAFERLGRGDILDGLREATHGTVTDLELMKAAVKFNDFKLPLEELGTMLAFAQQKAKDTGQSVDYMVDSIVTGLGRKSLMILDNLGLSASEIKERMKETGDMTKAVGAIIRDQMAAAGDYVETAADRAAQANVSLQNKMEELGRKFGPLEQASTQFWTSMKIGILDIVGGPLAELLNGLTEAGRLQNMLNNLNGDGDNTKVGGQLKKLQAIQKAGGSSYMFNSTLSGMMEDYNRQIMALDAQIKNGGKPIGGGSGSSQDVRYLQRQMDALKIMRDELKKGAQDILNPKTQNTITPTTDTKKGIKEDKDEFTEVIGLIGNAQERVSDLQRQISESWDEGEIARLTEDLKAAEKELQRLKDIGKDVDLDKLFPEQSISGASKSWAESMRESLISDLGNSMMAADKSAIQNIIKEGFTNGIDLTDAGNELMAQLFEGMDVPDDKIKELLEKVNEKIRENGGIELTVDTNTGEVSKKKRGGPMDETKKVVSGLSQVASGLQQMGIQLPEGVNQVLGVANGLMTIIGGITSIISATEVPAQVANTAALWALTEAMWANTFLGFSGGGIVGFAKGGLIGKAASGMLIGNHMSGDNLRLPVNSGGFIGVNDGELILNRAQQGVLADALQGGGAGNLGLSVKVTAEELRFILGNNSRRRGKGEYVTTNRLR